MNGFQRILVPLNIDAERHPSLATAAMMAKTFDAQLVLVHVFETPGYHGPEVIELVDGRPNHSEAELSHWRTAKAMLHQVEALAAEGLKARGMLVHGVVEESIFDLVRQEGVGLVVIGVRSRGGLERMLGGNLVTHMVNGSPCPVLVVPHP